ncbi:hypothetical protein [Tateyamaria pelophila]|uniref:hypothetical protein n=1 Tax=Tateyamaria pelophila TaxID=328415 RepID=UPI001CBB7A7C|nr:hypothetical protein [Tateyamaria pelophila]
MPIRNWFAERSAPAGLFYGTHRTSEIIAFKPPAFGANAACECNDHIISIGCSSRVTLAEQRLAVA